MRFFWQIYIITDRVGVNKDCLKKYMKKYRGYLLDV